jgi:RHS repeat-associated protein
MMRTLVATLILSLLPALSLADGPVSRPSTQHALQVYTAFGGTYPFGSISGAFQRYTFTGRESSAHNAAGAPMFYRNRMYSTALGRFGRRDPVVGGDPLYNGYVFPGNDPCDYSDPLGLTQAPEPPPQEPDESDFSYRERVRRWYYAQSPQGIIQARREREEQEYWATKRSTWATNPRIHGDARLVGVAGDYLSSPNCSTWTDMSPQEWLAKRATLRVEGTYSGNDPDVQELAKLYSHRIDGCVHTGVQVRSTPTNIHASLWKAVPTQFQEGEHGYNPLGFVSSRYATQEVWNVGNRWDVLDVYCCSQSAAPIRRRFRESILARSDRQIARAGKDVFTTTPVMMNQAMGKPAFGGSALTEESATYLGAGAHAGLTAPYPEAVNRQMPGAILAPMSAYEYSPALQGGTYGSIEPNYGMVKHHMPPNASTTFPYTGGPAIQMYPDDHRLTASWGRGPGPDAWRAEQARLISEGQLRSALAREIFDVRRVSRERYGMQIYNEAMQQMLRNQSVRAQLLPSRPNARR